MIKKTLSLIFICTSFLMLAQESVAIHLTEVDNLPDTEFYDIIEDEKGFIWLAANNGLYRYDGKTFKNYTNSEKRGHSVFELFEDSQGRIWCVNISGQFFYVENEKLVTFIDLSSQLKGSLPNYKLLGNTMYVFTRTRCFQVSLNTKRITDLYTDASVGVPIDKESTVLVTINDKLLELKKDATPKQKLNINALYSTHEKQLSLFSGPTILISIDDDLYLSQLIGTNHHFFFCDTINNTVKQYPLPEKLKDKHISNINVTDTDVWFCTQDGVFHYKYENKKFVYQKIYFENLFVTKVMSDKDSNYWFTTKDNGVFVIPNINIEKYPGIVNNQNIACAQKINDSTLIFGTTKGIFGIYNLKNKKVKTIALNTTSSISSLLYNSFYKKVIISQDNASNVLDLESFELINKGPFIGAKELSITSNNEIVVSSYNKNSLITWEDKKENNPLFLEKTLTNKRGYHNYYSQNSKATYVSMVDDFVRYDSLFTPRKIRFKDKPIFALDITETNDSIIWVTTFKQGILGIKNDSVIINYLEKDGLASNQTTKLKKDGNDLWIATRRGLQFLNRNNNTFKTLTKKDGLPSLKVSEISVFDEHVIFSSNNGLFGVEKIKAFKQESIPSAYITYVTIKGKETSLQLTYSLAYNQNQISFYFRARSFQADNNINYQYRLHENDQWITLANGVDNVQLSNLAYGKYTFELRAKNTFGKNISEVKKIGFTIAAPFWKQWWFYVAIIMLLLCGVYIYFRSKIERIKEQDQQKLYQQELETSLAHSELKSLKSQMNPHFMFNALNAIQSLIIKDKKEEAYIYLTKFSSLIRNNLNMSEKSFVNFNEEYTLLKTYLELEKLRFNKDLNYTFIDVETIADIKIPSMIIQPFVENAIKHGLLHKTGEKLISIKFKQEKVFKCIITDNGIGRKASEAINKHDGSKPNSFSTTTIKNRFNLLREYYKLDIGFEYIDLETDGVSSGTTVIINIPYL